VEKHISKFTVRFPKKGESKRADFLKTVKKDRKYGKSRRRAR
jgi:hypothetical protein